MTKTLQKRFIIAAMVAVSVLLLAVLGILNAVNAASAANEAERLLQIVLQDETRRQLITPPQGRAGPEALWRSEALDPNGWDVFPAEDFSDADDWVDGPFDLENFDGEQRRALEEVMGRGGLLSGQLTENDARSAVYFVVRFSPDGTAAADVSRVADVTAEDALALAQPLYAGQTGSGTLSGYRYCAGQQADGTTVYVFLNTANRRASVLRVALLSLLLGALAWGLMLLLVILLSKRAIRPIAENMEKQRRFVTDAGHEIKTPLAIIQANTEAMELRGGENKYTKNIRDQVTRLSGLMQDLLTLAKADESRTAQAATRFDFAALVRSTAESFQAPMELRGLSLRSALPPELLLKGDRSLLTRLVSILLDNAVKYARQDTVLTLTLRPGERFAVLLLTNECQTLPACPPEKLFDRFYRADEARTQASGGYGIGLSAARAIAEAHKGSIAADYQDQSITFTVKLPMK